MEVERHALLSSCESVQTEIMSESHGPGLWVDNGERHEPGRFASQRKDHPAEKIDSCKIKPKETVFSFFNHFFCWKRSGIFASLL